MTPKEKCSYQVYEPQGFGRFRRCKKRAVVERGGKPYCKMHDPVFVAQKRAEKEALWDKKWAERRGAQERRNLLAVIFEGIDNDTIEHNFEALKSAVRVVVHNK